MSNYSRDETEFGAFGDTYEPQPMIGGLLDFVTGGQKKKVEAKVATDLKKQGATTAQVAAYKTAAAKQKVNPKDVAKGLAISAAVMGPIVAPFALPVLLPAVGAAGATFAPLVAAAAPIAKAVLPTVKQATSTVRVAAKMPTVVTAGSVAGAHDLIARAALPGGVGSAAKKAIADTHAAASKGSAAAKTAAASLSIAASQRASAVLPPTPAGMGGKGAGRVSSADMIAWLQAAAANRPVTSQAAASAVLAAALAAPGAVHHLAQPSPAVLAATRARVAQMLPDLASTEPRYLVLDSGRVLSGADARQNLRGYLVRFNGSVSRQ